MVCVWCHENIVGRIVLRVRNEKLYEVCSVECGESFMAWVPPWRPV